MISLNIQIDDHLSPDLRRMASILQAPRKLMAAAGKKLEIVLREHFRAREGQPNAKGWPKRHFWAGIARSTALTSVSNDEAVVTISDPAMAQKLYGGTITPKRGKYLALPARAEAYKMGSPRESNANFLEVIFNSRGQPYALAERQATLVTLGKKGVKAKGSMGSLVWYFLVKSVTQAPDPEALPPQKQVEASVMQTVEETLQAGVK